MKSRRAPGSRPVLGSSSRRSSGPCSRPFASSTRRARPPESVSTRSRARSATPRRSSSIALLRGLGIEDVVDAEPEAAGIAEEKERERDAEHAPEDDLRADREIAVTVEEEKPRDRDADRRRVVHVDRAHEVALLALEHEPARGTALVHRERTAKERAAAAPRAPQTEPAPEDGNDVAWVHADGGAASCHTRRRRASKRPRTRRRNTRR